MSCPQYYWSHKSVPTQHKRRSVASHAAAKRKRPGTHANGTEAGPKALCYGGVARAQVAQRLGPGFKAERRNGAAFGVALAALLAPLLELALLAWLNTASISLGVSDAALWLSGELAAKGVVRPARSASGAGDTWCEET